MQGIGLSLPIDATVCWHIMPCRLLDCYHASEGLTASIISVCLPHFFPAGSWSSVVRKTRTYLPNFGAPSVPQTDASASYTVFPVMCFLLSNMLIWTVFCHLLFISIFATQFFYLHALDPAVQKPFQMSSYMHVVVFWVTNLVETYTLKMEAVRSSETLQSFVFIIGCTELQNLK